MALEKQLADTDSIYCTKVTNSNQSSIFISNLGDAELDVIFGAGYKSDDEVRLRLNKRNLAFNAVAHAIDGKTWYKRKSTEVWMINSEWLKARLSTLEDVFTGDYGVFIASLNKDDHSTQRLYMKGMASLSREDGNKAIALRDFLFSGDVIVLTKLDNGDVSFEIKIPDNPVIAFSKKEFLLADLKTRSRQLITYGAPGTGKSHKTKEETDKWKDNVFRTTFHPDSDYSTFVGAYKPSMSDDAGRVEVYKGSGASKVLDATHEIKKGISYEFIPQAFIKAYVLAWKKMNDAPNGEDGKPNPEPVFLVIEEINRGNCAQIFGDIFQLLDRNDAGYSEYPIDADSDLKKFLSRPDDKGGLGGLDADAISIKFGVEKKEVELIRDGKHLMLPPNLLIRATMNTSDQSLFPMDSAFKRRWDWEYVPLKDAGKGWKIKFSDCEVDWWKFLVEINKIVKGVTNSADKQLGYFFVKAKDSVIDAEMFVNKVAFYLWNDVFKDCELDGEAFKIEREGGEVDVLAFQDFFKEDGTINEEVLKNFLTKLVPQPENAPGGSEPGPAADGEA
jgi:hypothetical protein